MRESNSAHAAVGVERERANGDVREREYDAKSKVYRREEENNEIGIKN